MGERVLRAQREDVPWDITTDVVVAGSGAAGWSAAIGAALNGAEVLVLEKDVSVGGTTAKAGGRFDGEVASTWLWICNHPWMADLGLVDPRPEALRYLARLARPELYDPGHRSLGLPPAEHALIETFYDRGAEAVAGLAECGALPLRSLAGTLDYYADLHENAAPNGRGLYLPMPDGTEGLGMDIIESMRSAADALGVGLRTGSAVWGLVMDDDEQVVGVAAGTRASDLVLVEARRGAVFATGGFTHDEDLRRNHLRGPVLGGLASAGCTGDLVRIAAEIGLDLAGMNEAWHVPMVLDHAPAPVSGAFRLPGDSMIVVNTAGRRVVNEKTTYNEMTRAFFAWDPAKAIYPNLPLVMLYDADVSRRCRSMPEDAPVTEGGGNPLPPVAGEGHELVGETWAELAQRIDEKFAAYHHVLPGARLDDRFVDTLQETLRRWAVMSGQGVDADFGRGGTSTERRRSGPPRHDGMPNPTMHAFAGSGPYYAVVLIPGVLDTKGGPRIDTRARMLRTDGEPVPGLYGAGNAVASPAGQAYWAGGTTLGLAVTFGWIAGVDAAGRG
ncbi:MAG: FAD-dependent oxidoreductase [Actinomycetales bacterium]|nr:FAD-dependent oxidoreductase [Actinomycetales bacterium]